MNAFLRGVQPSCDDEWEFELPVSMIDVVFLLLVFFMCTTQFRSEEHALTSRLPRDEGSRVEDVCPEPPVELVVKIFWEGVRGEAVADPAPGARVAMTVDGRRCADPNELTRTLSAFTARYEKTPVVIDARGRVPFKWVLGAIDACARAGVRDVRFRAPARTELGSEWWHL